MVLMHYFQSNDLVEIKNITIQIPDNELANSFLKEFSKGQRLKKVCTECIGLTLVEPADNEVIFKSDK